MNFNQYTRKSLEAVQGAQILAQENHHQQMEQIHLLLALLQQEGGWRRKSYGSWASQWRAWRRRHRRSLTSCPGSPVAEKQISFISPRG